MKEILGIIIGTAIVVLVIALYCALVIAGKESDKENVDFCLATEKGHGCFASYLLVHPSLRLRYRTAQLFAKNSPPDCFLNAKTLSGFEPLYCIAKQ